MIYLSESGEFKSIVEDVPHVEFDEDNFEEMLSNLSGDAVKVEFYTAKNGHNYGLEYLLELKKSNPKLADKLIYNIEVFQHKGTSARKPLTEPLRDGMFEIRSIYNSNISRVICFFIVGNKAVVVNGYTKKQDKLDERVFEQALRLRAEYFGEEK